MRDYSVQNKKAWEYNAYEFWIRNAGLPSERAKANKENPLGMIRKYTPYFDQYEGVKIANICGSCGKKAIPLAILGADVTVFDISEDNKKYALEVAAESGVSIEYVVGDVLDIDHDKYGQAFDVVFMEGGILHYFHDINQFMSIMNQLLKPKGKMICSDFHPYKKINDMLEGKIKSYFSTDVFEGEMAHASFFPEEIRQKMPLCSYRKYTISEIINASLANGFTLTRFDEHPSWTDERLPGEFTLIATKN